jgi:hypothetical protein
MSKGGGGGISKETKELQRLQSEQTKKALADRARADKAQQEDQRSTARRAQMGLLSNILSKPGQKLGG